MALTPAQPKIDVRIAYEPGGQLGADYNRIFNETPHEWVLLLDHDVLLLNPHWYTIAQECIRQNPRAGIFTCWTNNIGNPAQRFGAADEGDSVGAHRRVARAVFEGFGTQTTVIDGAKCSGMLLLIRKAAWVKVGGFPGVGMFREDWTFGRKVQGAGFEVRRMDGLYVYHVRDRSEGTWIPGVDTSKEIRDRLKAEGKIGTKQERK
jgi:GT2 family glycosyltransferase